MENNSTKQVLADTSGKLKESGDKLGTAQRELRELKSNDTGMSPEMRAKMQEILINVKAVMDRNAVLESEIKILESKQVQKK